MSDEIDPVVEGIVAIGRELLNPMRMYGTGETIDISIGAREKLQKAAEALGLMDRIVKESGEDSDKSFCEIQPLSGEEALKSMGETRFKIVSKYDGEENDA